MKHWPKSRLAHACFAFVGATILGVLSFRPILEMRANAYNRESPHDGQNSLAAFIDAGIATSIIELGSGIVFFVLQRKISSGSGSKPTGPGGRND